MLDRPVVIALDAMGGDYAPVETVKGAVQGARIYGVSVELVGHPDKIQAELQKYDTQGLDLRIVEALDEIGMDETPTVALRKKKNASIAVTARRVKEGHADAMVAAGSTGAAMAAALFNMGRIKGVDRPAIAVALPSQRTPTLMIDGGANMDCPPALLVQFARLGRAYVQGVYGIENPKVGLLNVGSEKGKGNAFSKEAYALLEDADDLSFTGNAEGRDFFISDFDVVVCDGFAGNVAMKSAEGMATLFGRLIKQEFSANLWTKLVALLAKPILQKAKQHIHHEYIGGALLLGVDGICIIAHGGSSALAIENAIRVAVSGVEGRVMEKMRQVSLLNRNVIVPNEVLEPTSLS
jgi:glycerol-3-phosphate acyltransferase PlsX